MSTNNIITQVSKEDYLINTNNANNATTTTQTTTNVNTQTVNADRKPFSIWNIFCCCCSSTSNRGSAYQKDTLDLQENFLLPPITPDIAGKKTLVLDLDETLLHSSFKPIANPDFVIPVEIEDQVHKVYVVKRPHVDQFLQRLGKLYEIVVFTASLAKYADPVLDLLDVHKVVRTRLFREACSNYKGNYVKDLSKLGRELNNVIIIDNSPPSYLFHPENAIPIETWFDDENDTDLLNLLPILEDLTKVENVRAHLETIRQKNGKLLRSNN